MTPARRAPERGAVENSTAQLRNNRATAKGVIKVLPTNHSYGYEAARREACVFCANIGNTRFDRVTPESELLTLGAIKAMRLPLPLLERELRAIRLPIQQGTIRRNRNSNSNSNRKKVLLSNFYHGYFEPRDFSRYREIGV